jgi:hypothetical protein
MLYSILMYGAEAVVEGWTRKEEDAVLSRHAQLRQQLTFQRKLGPAFRLMPTTTATTMRAGPQTLVLDGPFAETKEQLLGIYVIKCASLDDAIPAARALAFDSAVLEIRPIAMFEPGSGVS